MSLHLIEPKTIGRLAIAIAALGNRFHNPVLQKAIKTNSVALTLAQVSIGAFNDALDFDEYKNDCVNFSEDEVISTAHLYALTVIYNWASSDAYWLVAVLKENLGRKMAACLTETGVEK